MDNPYLLLWIFEFNANMIALKVSSLQLIGGTQKVFTSCRQLTAISDNRGNLGISQ
jgi:hypothetical protein